jgi:hypothetical protein
MTMIGNDSWDVTNRKNQPTLVKEVLVNDISGLFEAYYANTMGCLRWSTTVRGINNPGLTGWVLCYPDGKPITYADAGQTGSIRVSASGSYMTL